MQARPDYADAHFNLALLLTRLERYQDALEAWERYLGLEPPGAQATTARRAATLCRMKLKEAPARTG